MTIRKEGKDKIIIEGPDSYQGIFIRRGETATIIYTPNKNN
jgi:hypothetical protein